MHETSAEYVWEIEDELAGGHIVYGRLCPLAGNTFASHIIVSGK